MFIDGIGILGYRSFWGEPQLIGPLSKINLFVGQNNSGKSNILRFLKLHYQQAVQSARREAANPGFDSLIDRPLGDTSGKWGVTFGVSIDGQNYNLILKKFPTMDNGQPHPLLPVYRRILESKALTQGTRLAWFPYEGPWGGQLTLGSQLLDNVLAEEIATDKEWSNVWHAITGSMGGGLEHNWIPATIEAMSPVRLDPPAVELVPAIRKVGEAGSPPQDYSGIGIIERLAQLQNPSLDKLSLKEQFNKINEFVRSVVGNETATLEIPHDRKMVLVHMDGRTLPLASLGTGIHEVAIIAAAATILREQLVCIEEPELHLHPLLQKKLLAYLMGSTSNQYFISTHSAHLLDTTGAAIFHVHYRDGHTTVDPVSNATDKSQVCADLGYRASDLMQANSIVWVEGPSDRIYVKHWLRALDPTLVEGLNYSIMFYGGRLLSHLSALDPEIDEFISLRRLNRYAAIVIDSDKSKKDSPLSETKARITKEFDQGPGFAWITKGREIENYVEHALLESAVKSVHPKAAQLQSTGAYDHAFHFLDKGGHVVTEVDKVKVARFVAGSPANLDILDLREKLNILLEFIRSANT